MITASINNITLEFETTAPLFSPSRIDAGTAAMLSCVVFSESDKVLDLGCGYGVVGIYAAKVIGAVNVVMADIDGNAVTAAARNASLNGVGDVKTVKSDGFAGIDDAGFTKILSNPPYHTDFNVAKHFIEKGFNRLAIGEKMYMVTKRKDWYKNKLIAIFGGVRIHEIDGYFVFEAERRSMSYAKKK